MEHVPICSQYTFHLMNTYINHGLPSIAAGQDYSQTSQLLIFNDTSIDFLVTVGIINNGYYEDDQTFMAKLLLLSADGYEQFVTISPSLATATIINDINGNHLCV